jgi:type VI secretion system secreted protein Hcp
MAVDMFLRLGTFKGESVDSKHKGEIDVLAWSWGASNSGTTHSGLGGGAGKVNVQDITVTKYVDQSSPNLWNSVSTGTHSTDAVLTVRKAGGTPVEYIKITLTEVLVTSVSTGGSGGEDRLTENIALNFAKFKFEYTTQDATGAAGTVIPFAFDIAANVVV